MKEMNFTTSHIHDNGHIMTMAWEHGIEMVAEFKEGGLLRILKGGEVKQSMPIGSLTIEEYIHIQEMCQEMSNQLGEFSHD